MSVRHLNRRPAAERFWARVDKDGPDGCWLWTGTRQNGYGSLRNDARQRVYAHRFVYELLVETIPDGMTIDHLCRTKLCVNPGHLEVVTRWENVRRGGNIERAQAARRARTHCVRGHAFDEANTHWYKGARICRACKADTQRRLVAARRR